MSTRVWTEIVCSRCSRSASGLWSVAGRIRLRALVSIAQSEGWMVHGDDHLCPECLKDERRSTRIAKEPKP